MVTGRSGWRRADRVRGLPLVLRVRVRMQETHSDHIHSLTEERVDLRIQAREVERHDLSAVGIEPLRDLTAEHPRNERLRRHPHPVVDRGSIPTCELEYVAETASGDESDGGSRPLDEGVDRHRGTVEEAFDIRWRSRESIECRRHFRCQPVGGRRLLLDRHLPRGAIERHEIDERAAHVHRDHGRAHELPPGMTIPLIGEWSRTDTGTAPGSRPT